MRKKILLINILLCCIFGTSDVSAQNPPLKLITQDWAPYNYRENRELKGFSVEIVREIMKELKVEYEIILLPHARGQIVADREPNILMFSRFRTPKREKKYKWIGPISESNIYFYKRKSDPRIFRTLADAKKVEIVTSLPSGLIHSFLIKNGFKNIIGSTTIAGHFLQLVNNRVDLVANTTPIGMTYYLKKANIPISTVEQTPIKILEFPLYISCSKSIPDHVIGKWQKALDKVKSSEKYEQIHNKYLLGHQ